MTRDFSRWRMLLPSLVGFALLASVAGEARAYEQRSNTISLGFQGGYGKFNGSGEYSAGTGNTQTILPYEEFQWGGGFGIHMRYSLDRTHAFGFTFEDQRYDRKDSTLAAFDQLQINNYLLDYFIYYRRRAKLSSYLTGGLGFHRAVFRGGDIANLFPGEGFTANLGGGVEYFLGRPFSIDASIKGYYLGVSGGSGFSANVMLGFQYYLLR